MLSRLSARRSLQLVELSRAPKVQWRIANTTQLPCQFNTTQAGTSRGPPTPPLPPPPPPPNSPFAKAKRAAKWTALFCLSSAAGIFAVGGAVFLHDAFTYTYKHIDRVPVDPLALHPELGGPKNLPVARVLVDDEDNEVNKKLNKKPKLVIVGGGWGVSRPSLYSRI